MIHQILDHSFRVHFGKLHCFRPEAQWWWKFVTKHKAQTPFICHSCRFFVVLLLLAFPLKYHSRGRMCSALEKSVSFSHLSHVVVMLLDFASLKFLKTHSTGWMSPSPIRRNSHCFGEPGPGALNSYVWRCVCVRLCANAKSQPRRHSWIMASRRDCLCKFACKRWISGRWSQFFRANLPNFLFAFNSVGGCQTQSSRPNRNYCSDYRSMSTKKNIHELPVRLIHATHRRTDKLKIKKKKK